MRLEDIVSIILIYALAPIVLVASVVSGIERNDIQYAAFSVISLITYIILLIKVR